MNASEHESGLAAFLNDQQARRAKSLLEKGIKGRKRLLAMFDHELDFSRRSNERIGSEIRSVEDVCGRLIALGAPQESYVMSVDQKLDGKFMTLREAVHQAYASGMGTFISCVPGRLGFFEGEDAGERFFLQSRRQP